MCKPSNTTGLKKKIQIQKPALGSPLHHQIPSLPPLRLTSPLLTSVIRLGAELTEEGELPPPVLAFVSVRRGGFRTYFLCKEVCLLLPHPCGAPCLCPVIMEIPCSLSGALYWVSLFFRNAHLGVCYTFPSKRSPR